MGLCIMSIKKILIFNPFGIGDVLFTTPLIRNLKERLKDSAIVYLANRRTQFFLKNNIFLDKALVFEKDEWRAGLKESKLKFLKKAFSFFRDIRKENFDVVFDLSLNAQYGFFLKLAGIKKRIGYNFKKRGRFLTHRIDISCGYKEKHVARYYLELLKFLDIEPQEYKFDLFLSPDSLSRAEQILLRQGVNKGDLLVAVCPGAGDSWGETAYFKRWPKESFLPVCEYLRQERDAKIILFGSKDEQDICDYIYNGMASKPVNLCGKVTLEEFCGLISFMALVVTNDGGPFHIAQALDRKAVGFFGPVDDKVYGIYPDKDTCFVLKKNVSCRPCYQGFKFTGCQYDKRCLREIPIKEAQWAVKSLIG